MPVRTYADYNATAPLRPDARAAMVAALDVVGNPSSAHREGARARRLVESARAEVAALVDRPPRQVVFTSGATEANVLALRGLLRSGDRLLTTTIEHASILASARVLAGRGIEVDAVPVTSSGEIDAHALEAALARPVTVAAVALANGEVGVVHSSETLRRLAAGVAHLHLDLAQAIGRLDVPVPAGASLALSAHKLGGPAGVGALVLPDGVDLDPLLVGGGQERGRRAGTENLLGIVGFGAAARALLRDGVAERERSRALRNALWEHLEAAVPGIQRNGPSLSAALPNTLNVTVPGLSGDAVLMRLDLAGVSASLGSACAAGSPEASHVLLAMGRDDDAARAGLRISFGWASNVADVDRIARAVVEIARSGGHGAAA